MKTCRSCFVRFCRFDRQGPDVGGRLASVKKVKEQDTSIVLLLWYCKDFKDINFGSLNPSLGV